MKVTINDIAKAANVSKATVSAVINNKDTVGERTRQRVLQVIEEYNFVPSDLARGLTKNRIKAIGLVVRDISNPFHSDITNVVGEIAYKNGYNLMLFTSEQSIQRERDIIEILIKTRVSGVIVFPQSPSAQTVESLEKLKHHRIPFVVVNEPLEGFAANYVYSDISRSMYEAIEHLVRLGHRRIAFQRGPKGVEASQVRENIFRRVMEDNEIPLLENMIFEGGADIRSGYQSALRFLRENPKVTALCAHNDLAAIGVLRAAEEIGLVVPKDLALISVDNIEYARDLRVPLTTVEIPTRAIGQTAIELLVRQLARKEPDYQIIDLPSRLVIRESSGLALES